MKKNIILSLILTAVLLVPIAVLADTAPTVEVEEVLGKITNWLLGILLAFAVFMIVLAGYHFVAAQGDPEKIKTARHFVLWAIVGIIVGVSSKAIVELVKEALGI